VSDTSPNIGWDVEGSQMTEFLGQVTELGPREFMNETGGYGYFGTGLSI
jgi:hypothetical protein